MSEWARATTALSAAVNDLHQRRGTLSRSEYEGVRYAIEVARLKADQARLKLDRHREEHSC
jgi:hypothetical protein